MKRRYHFLRFAGKMAAVTALIWSIGCDADDAELFKVVEDAEQVQLGYSAYSTRFSQAGEQFYDLDFDNPVREETGALYCNEYTSSGNPQKTSDGNNVRATCGLTFVSPRYAVTAAHCVDDHSCGAVGRKFKVRQFNIEDVYWRAVEEAVSLKIDGDDAEDAFEDGWEQNRYLNSDDGYETTFEDGECEVISLCHRDSSGDDDGKVSKHGRRNAELCKVDGKEFTADIALVFCPNRPIGKYLEVADASQVKVGTKVEAHWYYELLDVPLAYSEDECKEIYRSNPNSKAAKACPAIVAHYNNYTGKTDNYHYMGYDSDRESQLFPLVNIPFDADGVKVSQTVRSIDDDSVSANVWGCHGMSGTGLLVKDDDGKRLLVAPTSTNTGYSQLGGRLCEKDTLKEGQTWKDPLLNYPNPKYTHALAAWAKEEDLKVHYIVPTVITALF